MNDTYAGYYDNDTYAYYDNYTYNYTDISILLSTVDPTGVLVEKIVYGVGVPISILICIAAVIVNGHCLAAVRWIRGPLSPTLQLSISLAAADLYTSILVLSNLVLGSYLPVISNFKPDICGVLTLEALRLGGLISIVGHLTTLSANHHLGIVRPFRYPGIATSRNTKIVLVLLWLLPPTGFLLYFGPGVSSIGEGLTHPNKNCPYNFILKFSYRLAFSMFLVVALAVMCCIYAHLLKVIHTQTVIWVRGGVTAGSCKHHGPTRKPLEKQPSERTKLKKHRELMINVRAVYTTLHILGSFILFYLPSTISYLVVCPEGCTYKFFEDKYLWINCINMMLMVAKPLTNPVIYAARMHEVKEATKRMHQAFQWRWCNIESGIGKRPKHNTMEPLKMATALCRVGSSNSSQPQATTTLIVNNDTINL